MDFKTFYGLTAAEIAERIVKKKVVRGGKRVIKRTSDKPGFKVISVDGKFKEVKIKASEKIKRKKGAKKGARKAKGKSKQAAKKRLRSIKKRGGLK